ncbi:hypothetical protein MLD38_020787 [Melastoma candidum]|uniref:Uncharacterized protein n=1 Tax=Melastoma candidum TaxID=119954 RepID=A0ACB9QGZ9_9MYRT|nr:hypothetical protein MLD38_020787 [Melastoma candidum]
MDSLLHHPVHDAPLELCDWTEASYPRPCDLCHRPIGQAPQAYHCNFYQSYIHKTCAEAPLAIRHPFHPQHPLVLIHRSRPCSSSNAQRNAASSYGCHECGFEVNLDWALCTLPAKGLFPAQLPEESLGRIGHIHPLTPFNAKWEHEYCLVCDGSIVGNGYICLLSECDLIIHAACLKYLRYRDGTVLPLVKHRHQFVALHRYKSGHTVCNNCELDISGDYIACPVCDVFYHRDCANVPRTLAHLMYPGTLLTLSVGSDYDMECVSCCSRLRDCLVYVNEENQLYLHTDCALRTQEYCEKGERLEIKANLHEHHQMLLCHRTADHDTCNVCKDNVRGLGYRCAEPDCSWLLHKSCAELKLILEGHHHHPKHQLTIFQHDSNLQYRCSGCRERITGFYRYSCAQCPFHLDIQCTHRTPTIKHYLHQHNLADFGTFATLSCIICGTNGGSTIFRCVQCNFSIHLKCMELPRKVKNEGKHLHEMTLWESHVEEDGECVCFFCEKERDRDLGVYVCELCNMSYKLVADIWCAYPQLKESMEKARAAAIANVDVEIKDLEGKRLVKEKDVNRVKQQLMAQEEQLKALEEDLKATRNERETLMSRAL